MWHGSVRRRQFLLGVGVGIGTLTVGTRAVGASKPQRHVVGTNSKVATNAAKRKAKSVHRVLDFEDIGQAVAGEFPPEARKGLRHRKDVRYIEEDRTMQALGQTLPWGVDRIDADLAHTNDSDGDGSNETGDGVDIAIVDSGIDRDHPDLQANVGTGESFVDYTSAWDDDNGHGTHVAGIVGAIDNDEGVVGVAPESTLHAAKVLDDSGTGSYSDIAAGIEWAADQGYDVVNLSLGGDTSTSTLKDACQYAHDRGVLLVAAAGNSGDDQVIHPARYDTVIAVSATTKDDGLASFSNTGTSVELAAPGKDVYSTDKGGGYATHSGTSMACPHVAGAGALVMANGKSHTEARTQLNDTAEDIDLASNEQGNGLVDPAAALGLDSSPNLGEPNKTPTVALVEPNDGDTVSGTVTIQVDASDSEDDDTGLDVDVSIDGSWRDTTYDSESGYYEHDWDTTNVSEGEHTLGARVTDSEGATAHSSEIAVTVKDDSDSALTATIEDVSENERPHPHAEFEVEWTVSDDDGDLDFAHLTLTDNDDGETERTRKVKVKGSEDGGATRLKAHKDDGSGHSYTVELTVSDQDGHTISDSTTVSETEDKSTRHPPGRR